MTTIEEKLKFYAESFQNDCHTMVNEIFISDERSPALQVQDATNVWIFQKLAQFEIRLQEIEKAQRNSRVL